MNIKSLSAALIMLAAFTIMAACGMRYRQAEGFNEAELELIHGSDSIMRVLTIDDLGDLSVLRAESSDLSDSALMSDEFARLSELMVATVTHPSQDGVGIAGPQVGLNRRVIAVQRFDKEGEPFEVYPNVRIVWTSDSLATGPEGCLSVPDRRGDVLRSQEIVIEYADIAGVEQSRQEIRLKPNRCTKPVPMVRDTVSGFTAVIFQHEIDHLNGVLYIDRLR
jgi:peptide deformylase